MKQKRHRGRVEIIFDILHTCRKPINKTTLMRRANINNHIIEKYICELVQKELIGIIPYKKTWQLYKTTDKGLEALKSWKEVKRLLGEPI